MVMNRQLLVAAAAPLVFGILFVVFLPYLNAPPHLNYSKKDFHIVKTIELPAGGPESLDWDPNGEGPYTGVEDGRILKWLGDDKGWADFAVTSANRENCTHHVREMEHICGRPLGVHFEKKSGDLYICDCYKGIMKVGPGGGVATKVVDEAAGRKFTFTNHMDIDEVDDILYFTDSSDKYAIRNVLQLFLSGDRTGRLISYNKNTKETKVLIDGLAFPNGVALSKDRSFVLVSEPPTNKIYRYWLSGPKAGTHHVFAVVPGPVDNMRRNDKGEFWLALHSKQTPFLKLCMIHPLIGKSFFASFKEETLWTFFEGFKPHAVAMKLGENGEVLETLEDPDGKNLKFISEVQERNGQLWVGNIFLPYMWVYDLK